MIFRGGRITSKAGPGNTVRVKISGGTMARRANSHTALLVCCECQHMAYTIRADHQPMSNLDISEALHNFDHVCEESNVSNGR